MVNLKKQTKQNLEDHILKINQRLIMQTTKIDLDNLNKKQEEPDEKDKKPTNEELDKAKVGGE